MTSLNPSESATNASKTTTRNHLTIHVTDDQDDVQLDMMRYQQLATAVLERQGVNRASELSVIFVSSNVIAELNQQHMGHQGPTDVLAFPIDEHATQPQDTSDTPLLLGDVVICPSVAADNCSSNKNSYPGHRGTVTDEIDLLVVHGILHVLGMDHADEHEQQQMQKSERTHLAAFRESEV